MSKYQVAAYYFPNYHVDPRNAEIHGPGWMEWELVKRAEPRFAGHQQPRIPLWGYEDESDPAVMAKKIDAAADHAVDAWIFDWYWYENRPFLNRCLDEGFLRAPNQERIQFALMWANHDWLDIHPYKRKSPYNLLYPGQVSAEVFDELSDEIVQKYFTHPQYWKIDGKPYFSIYELMTLVKGLGGIDSTRKALDQLREKVSKAGLPGLHLNAVVWGVQILPSEQAISSPTEMLAALGFDSVTSYVWIHHVPLETFPVTPYADVLQAYLRFWQNAQHTYGLPYFPNASAGWDSSPRTVQSDIFTNAGYPFTPVLGGATPAAFQNALMEIRARMDADPKTPPILTINSWNEWTEGSYLEPDTLNGWGYLEAIRSVFGQP
jgi:hypothetical protein